MLTISPQSPSFHGLVIVLFAGNEKLDHEPPDPQLTAQGRGYQVTNGKSGSWGFQLRCPLPPPLE